MSVTRSQLRTCIRTEMKLDRRGRIWGDTEINDSITDAIDQISVDNDYRWEELLITGTDTTVATQQEYLLPTDFVTLDLVRVNGIPMGSTTYKEIKLNYKTFPSGSPSYYYDKDYKLGLHPIPSQSGVVIDYEYRGSATVMTQDTDNMIFKDNMKRLVVLQAAFILFSKFADQQNLTRSKVKSELYEKELGKAKKRNALGDIAQIRYKTAYQPRRSGDIRTRTARRFGISIS